MDAKLVAALKNARTTPMCFAFVAKGMNDGILLLNKSTIHPKEITDARTTTGGKILARGRCVGEQDKLVFEVGKEPPPTLAKQVKAIIHRDTGMNLAVEFRVVAGMNDDGVVTHGVETPTQQPPPSAPPPAPPPPAPPPPPPTATKPTAPAPQQQSTLGSTSGPHQPMSNVLFTQSRLAWDQTRKKIQAELKKLEQSILEVCLDPDLVQNRFDFSTLASDTKTLYTILDSLDTRLIDKLDEALNEENPAERAKHQAEASAIVKEYVAFVQSNNLMSSIDENGFTPVTVRKSALSALQLLQSKL